MTTTVIGFFYIHLEIFSDFMTFIIIFMPQFSWPTSYYPSKLSTGWLCKAEVPNIQAMAQYWNGHMQQEVSSGIASAASSIYSHSPSYTSGVTVSHHPQMGPSNCPKTSSGLPLILHYGELYNYFFIYHNVTVIQKDESVSRSVLSDFCNPMDCSPPGFSVHGILQARTLE